MVQFVLEIESDANFGVPHSEFWDTFLWHTGGSIDASSRGIWSHCIDVVKFRNFLYASLKSRIILRDVYEVQQELAAVELLHPIEPS